MEELFQDFFLFLVSKPIPDYVQNIKGYICRALTNDIHDFFGSRRVTARSAEAICGHAEICFTGEDRIADLYGSGHGGALFRLAEKRSPPYLARTFPPAFREQCNIREISARIGVPPRAVSVYLSKAVKYVRECVERDGDQAGENRVCANASYSRQRRRIQNVVQAQADRPSINL
jgi:DNA-directed RNA polymerase specialized sigma24 family protein